MRVQPARVYIRARSRAVLKQYTRVRRRTSSTKHADMKFFGVILLLAVASCHAASHAGLAERSVFDTGLVAVVEQIRELLRTGNEELGIPVLEPFEAENLDFDIDNDSMTLKGSLSDLRVDGLTDFTADTLTFSLIGIKFTYCYNWQSINVTSKYVVDGTVVSVIPVYGSGDLDAEIKDLSACGTLSLSVKSGYLYVRSSTVVMTLGGFDLQMTGLLNDDGVSELVSAVASDVVPQLVVDFETQISEFLNTGITSIFNEILGTMTLAELIALITG